MKQEPEQHTDYRAREISYKNIGRGQLIREQFCSNLSLREVYKLNLDQSNFPDAKKKEKKKDKYHPRRKYRNTVFKVFESTSWKTQLMDILGLRCGKNQLDRVWRRAIRQIRSHAHRFTVGKKVGLAGQRKRQLSGTSIITQNCRTLLQREREQSIIHVIGEKDKQ